MNRIFLGIALAALSAAASAQECDWVLEKKADPMTDVATCSVRSEAAKITFYRHGTDRPNVSVGSAYTHRQGLKVRVDDGEVIQMGDDAGSRQRALDKLLPLLETGKRIRVQYLDHPATQNGDAPICTLPELLRSC